jgi:threonine dehydrogenase-like Zn-dependent dehydrogenase
MAEYVKVPARCLHHVPDSLPFELACLTEPHSVAYNAMCGNAEIKPGDLVVVLGPGPIGLLCARMAALSGAYPLVVAGLAGDAARLKTARELGATHTVNIRNSRSRMSSAICRRSARTSSATRRAQAVRSTPR